MPSCKLRDVAVYTAFLAFGSAGLYLNARVTIPLIIAASKGIYNTLFTKEEEKYKKEKALFALGYHAGIERAKEKKEVEEEYVKHQRLLFSEGYRLGYKLTKKRVAAGAK